MKRWTTGQLSKERDISVRTLRYYDQINLLTPSFKDEAGKRYYAEDDVFTLEKIIILKSLSLPLEDIRVVLENHSFKQTLITHYDYLQEQLSELQASIENTTSMINMLDLEDSLSWDRVSELVQSSKRNAKKWVEYFHEHEKSLLEKDIPNLSSDDETTQHYLSLLRRMEWCIKQGIAPESDEGFQIASELIELSDRTFNGDPELMEKFWEVRKLPAEETGLYPISEEVLEFAERCIAHAENKEPVKG